jgi:hypothetical protein
MPKDFKTSLAGLVALGLVVASFLTKDPHSSQTLLQIGMAFGGGGLLLAKDSTPMGMQPPPAPPVLPTLTVGKPPSDMMGK